MADELRAVDGAPRGRRAVLLTVLGATCLLALSVGLSGRGRSGDEPTYRVEVLPSVSDRLAALAGPSPAITFAEIARDAGIDFVHVSGTTEAKHFPTANGSGVAAFDYDNDGRLDLYFATCAFLPLGPSDRGPNRLYRNLGGNAFEDATRASGLEFRGFTHGVVVGDVDNDGDPDVFLCNYGPNALFLNNGDGTFRDISREAGIDRPGWSSGGAFLDYDNDGDLDLYVSNYGEWSLPADDRFCTDESFNYLPGEAKVRIYCSPKTIRTVRHFFYRNNGDRTFTDVTVEAGLGRSDGRGFGVVAADLNGDGLVDLYVANDMCPNFVFLNKGDGTFDDATEGSGAGFDGSGQVRSGMGVDAEDLDGDGLPEVFVTNFQDEPNSVFANLGGGQFQERSAQSGMAADSMPWVGWGCSLSDFDNDGWVDAFVANGHVDDNLHLLGRPDQYAQPPLLHRNVEGKGFLRAGEGAYFSSRHVARGVVSGDLDNDGDVDLVVSHKDGPPAVLRNDTASGNHWIRLRLVGTASNRDAIGARVEVEAGGRTIVRQRKGGTSLESSHDPRLLIGLGRSSEARRVTVRWPSGTTSHIDRVTADATYEMVEPRTSSPSNSPTASRAGGRTDAR